VGMALQGESEVEGMLTTCVRHYGPASVRCPRGLPLGVKVDSEAKPLSIGKAGLLCEGTDVAIVAIGVPVSHAVTAATRLEEEGISTAVVNARFVKPLDQNLIVEVAKRVRYVVTVEEGCKMGGFGSVVLEALSDGGVTDVMTKVIGLPDWYIEQGPQDFLRERYG